MAKAPQLDPCVFCVQLPCVCNKRAVKKPAVRAAKPAPVVTAPTAPAPSAPSPRKRSHLDAMRASVTLVPRKDPAIVRPTVVADTQSPVAATECPPAAATDNNGHAAVMITAETLLEQVERRAIGLLADMGCTRIDTEQEE